MGEPRLGDYAAASDPARLTWAVFELPAEAHAIRHQGAAGVIPPWPADHLQDASCPCRPRVYWHSAIAPRPLYEHRDLRDSS